MIWIVYLHGLTVGVLCGIVLRDAHDLFAQSRKERNVEKPKLNWGRAFLTASLVAAVLLQLIVGVLLIDSRRDQALAERERAAYSECTNRWQQDFAAAYKARLRASLDVNDAMEEVVRAVADDDDERFRESIAAYIAVRDHQEQERRKTPYPPLPNTLCGGGP